MSAPATKPDLAELTTSARGGARSIVSIISPSSSSTARERLLTEAPALSIVSQATPSSSVVRRQCAVVLSKAISSSSVLVVVRCASGRSNLEVADQRAMIREAHVGYVEVRDLDSLGVQ